MKVSAALSPFDDHAARAAYVAWIATNSQRESETFKRFWERISHDPDITVYGGWLLLAAAEHQRHIANCRQDWSRAVDNVLQTFTCKADPNWVAPVLLWWLYRYREQLSEEQRQRCRRLLLNEKYWMADPGEDQRCYFTENHQIIYHVNEYLAGQLFANERFSVTGQPGHWHRDRGRSMILRWMDWRARFGFSEFKSLGYSDVLLMILTTLREFTLEPFLRDRADALLDLILTGYALHSFRGNLAAAQGRGSPDVIFKGEEWMPSATGAVLWGVGNHREVLSAGAIALALSDYQVPSVLQAIARDQHSQREIIEREGLDVDEAAAWGIDPSDDTNIMFFWGNQQYCHPRVLPSSLRVLPWDGYYMAERIYRAQRLIQTADEAGQPRPTDLDNTEVGCANQYAWRTAEYKLASVRDFRPGGRGFQQHVWQATLPGYAMAFSQNPYGTAPFTSPGYWKGHGVLPRVAQYRHVLMALHRIPDAPDLTPATHVYFPKWAFDEVRECGRWVFGRKGDGYLAVYSHQSAHWRDPDPAVVERIHRFDSHAQQTALASPYDWYAPGDFNVIVCEMGNPSSHGTFSKFVSMLVQSSVIVHSVDEIIYASPSLGQIMFGWSADFRVNGSSIPLRSDHRLHSPFGRVRFGDTVFRLEYEGFSHEFDPLSGQRRSR